MKRSNFYSILYISLTVLILILVGSTLNIAKAEDSLALIPERPSNEKLVFNLSQQFPNFLSVEETNALNTKLGVFAKESSNQIVVLITDTIANMEVNDFATQTFNKWGIGQSDKNNGVLILIKPTVEEGGRKIYISTGYGLEAVIPDLMAKRVIDEVISPSFKAAQFYAGLDKATDILMQLAVGEFDEEVFTAKSKSASILWLLLLPFLFMFFSEMLLSRTGETVDISRRGMRRRHGAYYLPFFMGSPYSYHRHSSSGFGSSGSGFGGFGGFGGGMSGGGGAGGSGKFYLKGLNSFYNYFPSIIIY